MTGWPPGLLQDDDRNLSRWLARRACGICWRNKLKGELSMRITPGILRDLADILEPLGTASRGEFMCLSLTTMLRFGYGWPPKEYSAACAEFEILITAFGIETLTGVLFTETPGSWRPYYRANAMEVRFMFLEFIALYLEGEANSFALAA